MTSSPVRSETGWGRSPIRSFGPCRSAISASGRLSSSCTSRSIRARSACSSWEPWEKFSRAASMPARASASNASFVADAGPIVAMIFVRRYWETAGVAIGFDPSVPPDGASAARSREGVPAGIFGRRTQLLFDAEQLVVLRDPIRPRGSARLDLAGVCRDREVGDRRVLRLARAVRDHGRVLPRDGQPDRLERLRQRPDLIDLDEDRVLNALLDPAPQAVGARDEQVVADELQPVAQPLGQQPPVAPLVLREAVLDGHERVALREVAVQIDHLVAVARGSLAFEDIPAVAEELACGGVERECDPITVPHALGGEEDELDRLVGG